MLTREERMRRCEWFHTLTVPGGMYIVLRMDGRCFSKLTKNLEHPFDDNFHVAMTTTTQDVFREFDAIYGETHSDEISILLTQETDMFSREVEKLVSVSAAHTAGVFSAIRGIPASFDSRIVMLPTWVDVVDYFQWRQADAYRCCINSWLYWKLRNEKKFTAGMADSYAKHMTGDQKNADLFENFGINVTTDIPAWQKRGTGFYWEEYTKDGYDPIKQEEVQAKRRRIRIDDNLPCGQEYRNAVFNKFVKPENQVRWHLNT